LMQSQNVIKTCPHSIGHQARHWSLVRTKYWTFVHKRKILSTLLSDVAVKNWPNPSAPSIEPLLAHAGVLFHVTADLNFYLTQNGQWLSDQENLTRPVPSKTNQNVLPWARWISLDFLPPTADQVSLNFAI
jgi:hypothetical protein